MVDWLIPVLTFVTGGLGGYLGASRKIVVLETHLQDLRIWKDTAHTRMHSHGNDLLIHDLEIESICRKLDIPRARRQLLREFKEE